MAGGPIGNVAGSPVASGTTPVYTALLVDEDNHPIPGSHLQTLTLTIADTLTGLVINGVAHVNILNTGRGSIDEQGNLTVTLTAADTGLPESPVTSSVQRSLIIDWTYNAGNSAGRHQANFTVLALAGA